VQDIADSLDVAEKANAAHQRNFARMQQLLKDKHERPGRDVPSRMISHPSGLTDDEILIDLLIVMAAAQQPTANWIGNALRLMLIDDQFSADPAGWPEQCRPGAERGAVEGHADPELHRPLGGAGLPTRRAAHPPG